MGVGAFSDNTQLTTVKLSNGMTTIMGGVFSGCTSLKNLTLPTNLTQIGATAFENCTSLTGLVFPSTLKTLYANAFKGCTGLETVYFPDGVTTINASTFSGCASTTGMVGRPGGTVESFCSAQGFTFVPNSGTCDDKLTWALNQYGQLNIKGTGNMTEFNVQPNPFPKDFIKGVVIEEGVTSVGASAFIDCTGLTYVTLPSTLKQINRFAFYDTSITNLTLPAGTYVSVYAFASCEKLATIKMTGENNVGMLAFSACRQLQKVRFQEGTTSIDTMAFQSCSKLAEVYLPASLTVLGEKAFNACSDSLVVYGDDDGPGKAEASAVGATFIPYTGDCSSTEEDHVRWTMDFDSGTLYFTGTGEMEDYPSADGRPYLSYADQIVFAVVDEGITQLGSRTLSKMPNLDSASLPSTLAYVGIRAFYQSGIVSIDIPQKVRGFGYDAFADCKNLLSVNIHSDATSLGTDMFLNCDKLKQVTFDGEIITMNNGAFRKCSALERINGGAGLFSSYSSIIGENAFEGCASLKELHIPQETKVKDTAFTGCTALTVYGFSGSDAEYAAGNCSVKFVAVGGSCGSYASWSLDTDSGLLRVWRTENAAGNPGLMFDCESMTDQPWSGARDKIKWLEVGEGIIYIGDYAFTLCNLQSVSLPESLVGIGKNAFLMNAQLQGINIPNSVETLGDGVFGLTGLKSVTLPKSLKEVPDSAFSLCGLMTSVVIPDGVTSIGSDAFSGANLDQAALPDSAIYIGENAFKNNTNLANVWIGSACTSIAGTAFANCPNVMIVAGWDTYGHEYAKELGLTYAVYLRETNWQMTLPAATETVDYEAFTGTSVRTLFIPYGVKKIDYRAFADCPNLELVHIPDGCTVDVYAFSGCPNLAVTGNTNAYNFAKNNGLTYYDTGAVG